MPDVAPPRRRIGAGRCLSWSLPTLPARQTYAWRQCITRKHCTSQGGGISRNNPGGTRARAVLSAFGKAHARQATSQDGTLIRPPRFLVQFVRHGAALCIEPSPSFGRHIPVRMSVLARQSVVCAAHLDRCIASEHPLAVTQRREGPPPAPNDRVAAHRFVVVPRSALPMDVVVMG